MKQGQISQEQIIGILPQAERGEQTSCQYNEERPHSQLGYRTPAEFKADWLADQAHPSHTARS